MENEDYFWIIEHDKYLKTYKELNAICKKIGHENVKEFLQEFGVVSFYMSETMGSKKLEEE